MMRNIGSSIHKIPTSRPDIWAKRVSVPQVKLYTFIITRISVCILDMKPVDASL